MLVDADGVIQWANPATADVLGYRADDLVGVHVARSGRARRSRRVAGAGRASCSTIRRRRRAAPSAAATRTAACAGPKAWRATCCRSRASAASSSITATSPRARRPKQQLKATEDRYGHLFYSAADIIFEADAEGYFRFVNPQTLRVFEFDARRSDRPPLHRVHPRRLPPADPAALLPADAASGRPNSYVEFPAVTKSGREVWLGQNAWIITDAAGQAGRHAGGGARHHRAAPRRRSAARRRGEVPRPRRAVADGRLHPAERAAGLRQSEGGRDARLHAAGADRRADAVRVRARAGSRAGQRSAGAPRSRRACRACSWRVRGVRKDGEVIQVEAFCSVTEFGNQPRDSRDRARHQRSREARGSAAPGAEDGSGRPPRRRHRARLQQPADGDSRQRRADVAPRQGRSGDGRGGRRDPARRRSRRLADAPAAGVQPQAGAAAGRARPQRDRRRRVAHGAPPDRHRRAVAPRAGAVGVAGAGRSRRRSSRCCST